MPAARWTTLYLQQSFQVFQYFFIQNKTLKKKKKTLKGSLILEAILNYLYINLCNYVADGHI